MLWNPLVCRGTSMPGNTLLLAKLTILVIATDGVYRLLEAPFAPLLGVLGVFSGSSVYEITLTVAFVLSAVALVFNQWVRTSSAVAGTVVLLGVSGSMAGYHAHLAFAGCVLLLCSLHGEKSRPRLVRWFVVVTLGLTALTALTDVDWITGRTMAQWIQAELAHPALLWSAEAVPFIPWPVLLAWLMILGPLSLLVGLGLPNRSRILIWIGTTLLLLTSLAASSAETTAFLIVLGVAVIAFLDWPREHLRVTWPRACGLPLWLRIALDQQDWDHRIEWPMPEDPDGILVVEIDERRYEGARGLTTLLLYSPFFYVTTFVTFWIPHLFLPPAVSTLIHAMIAAPLLAIFLRPRYLQVRAKLKQAARDL